MSVKFAQFPSWILNPSHPKLTHLPISLPNPSYTSSDHCPAGNRRFPGRRSPLLLKIHLNIELHAPATVFLVQWLKSNLGNALMLVLPSFHCVPRVSALVHDDADAMLSLVVGCTPLCRVAVHAGSARLCWPRCLLAHRAVPLRRRLAGRPLAATVGLAPAAPIFCRG